MVLTQQDRSSYLKGLLILVGKDKSIGKHESSLLMEVSKILGFDPTFCKDAINELLENEYIIEEPPTFSHIEIAKAFIKDGIRIAFSDKELHLYELSWLKAVSDKNKIDAGWGLTEFEKYKISGRNSSDKTYFEISKLV
ncbi:hypothetical protein C0389_00375 [bacterium]|nr:hypothetical protein [bacterium]